MREREQLRTEAESRARGGMNGLSKSNIAREEVHLAGKEDVFVGGVPPRRRESRAPRSRGAELARSRHFRFRLLHQLHVSTTIFITVPSTFYTM